MKQHCEWLGPEQTNWPFVKCGAPSLAGKSYCGEHFWQVYKKGTATAGRRNERAIDREIEQVKRLQDMDEPNS